MASKFDKEIARRWPDDQLSQAIAQRLIAPLIGKVRDHEIIGYLDQGARLNTAVGAGEMEQADALALMSSDSLKEMGIRPDVIATITEGVDDVTANFSTIEAEAGATEAADEPQKQPEPSPAPAKAQPAAAPAATHRPFATPDRAALQAEIDRWQKAMKQPEQSEGWNEYWKGGGSQAYGAALRALEALDAPPAPADAAPGPAQGGE